MYVATEHLKHCLNTAKEVDTKPCYCLVLALLFINILFNQLLGFLFPIDTTLEIIKLEF